MFAIVRTRGTVMPRASEHNDLAGERDNRAAGDDNLRPVGDRRRTTPTPTPTPPPTPKIKILERRRRLMMRARD